MRQSVQIVKPTDELRETFLQARKAKKLTQGAVDRACGWRAPHYSYFERGKKEFKKEMVEKMAEALDLQLDFGEIEVRSEIGVGK